MKKTYAITAFILALMLLISAFPITEKVFAADVATLMRCRFRNSATVTAGSARIETTADITADGVVLTPSEDTEDSSVKKLTRKNGNVLIDITSTAVSKIKDYDNVKVTVKYKDNGYGWFFLRYIEKYGNSSKETDIVNLTNTGEEKTHTFVVSDVAFLPQGLQDNSVSPSKYYDFELCTSKIWSWQADYQVGNRAWSKESVTVSEITIATDGTESPIDVSASSANIGNVFYGAETPEINMTYKNKSSQSKNFDAKYTISKFDKDMNKTVVYESTGHFSLSPNEEEGDRLIIPVSEYGLYFLETELYNSSNTISQSLETEFSRCVSNDALNTHLGASTHFVRDGAAKEGLEMLEKGGFGLARESVYWSGYEIEPGKYNLTDKERTFLEELSKTDIDALLLLYANNPIYDESAEALSFPPEAVLPKFKEYITAVLNESLVRQNINMIEIWNEPDIMKYWSTQDISNDNESKGKIYAKVLETAYDAAKAVSPNYQVGAFGACNLWGAPGTTFVDWTLNYLGGKQKFDNLILHPYMGVTDDVEFGSMGTASKDPRSAQAYRINRMRGLINGGDVYNYATKSNEKIKGEATGNSYNYALNSSVWHSEFGYSSAMPYDGMCTGSDYLQASLLIRGLNQIRQNSFDDKIWIYDLFNDGEQSNEEQHNYGLLNSLKHITPMSAKYSYLAAANYNKMTSSASKITEIKNTDFSYITQYKSGIENKDVYLLWTAKETSKIYFNFGSDVKFYDLLGNELSQDDVRDGNDYKLSREPFYAVQSGGISDADTGIKELVLTDGIRDISGENLSNYTLSDLKIVALTDNSGVGADLNDTDIIIAAYDNDTLLSAVTEKLDWSNPIKMLNFKTEVNPTNIKAFAWKNFKPLCKAFDNNEKGEKEDE